MTTHIFFNTTSTIMFVKSKALLASPMVLNEKILLNYKIKIRKKLLKVEKSPKN